MILSFFERYKHFLASKSKKRAPSAIRISSVKPSIDTLLAKVSGNERPFTLFNLSFCPVNQLDQILGSKKTLTE